MDTGSRIHERTRTLCSLSAASIATGGVDRGTAKPPHAIWSCLYAACIAFGVGVSQLDVGVVKWKDVGDTVQAFVTAGGIVVGGVFAYYKFVKDRIYRPRVTLDINAGTVVLGTDVFLKCAVSVHNQGNAKLSVQH